MSAQSKPAPVRILIAEDSPTQALRLRIILERQGYEVLVATNGREALEMAHQHGPTLIISDVVMPEMDGYGLSRGIKADRQLRGIPVMLVTTLSDPEDVIRGIEAGADNFVVKPFEEEYMSGRVRFLLDNRGLEAGEEVAGGVTVRFKGESHVITATREQILNLLLSTYEAAVERNRELTCAQGELQAVNAQLQVAMREIEAFSQSASHDLRAPLHKVRGFGEVLLQDCAGQLDETGRHYVERMIAGIAKMEGLIDDMLSLARVTQASLVAEDLDLGALAARILEDLREQEPGRRFEARIEPDLRAWGDPRLFEIALSNLLGNAWKFTAGRDPARIEVGRRGREGRFETYFVRDNGAGFDPAGSPQLFTAFQRLHNEREFPGTGLGLATVKRVVERHGGSVSAEGEPGKGATFLITIPVGPLAGTRS